MKRLTKRQILLLHEQLLQEFGGTPGVRDEGLLDSALAAPFQTFDGQSLYPSVQAKAAQLGFGLVCNHPFCSGSSNTRNETWRLLWQAPGFDYSLTIGSFNRKGATVYVCPSDLFCIFFRLL